MYRFVVDEYFSKVPEAQRYGITIWNPLDSSDNPAGLWTQNYERKRAYGGFATGLMNGLNSGN
jgi:endo-1,4-beta-xylanase